MVELSQEVLKRRVFRQDLLDYHASCFMLSQTPQFVKNKTVIDVGAATGMYTWFWSQFADQVYAFEAVPEVYKQLQKVENARDNVEAFEMAVGRYNGNVKFWVDDKRLSNSGLRNLVNGQEITVECTTLDSIFNKAGFIKIDVEGNELDVIRGSEKIIKNSWPVLMVEIYPKFNDGPVSNTYNYLEDLGYKGYYNLNCSPKLRELHSVDHFLDVVLDEDLGSAHDYDFLFVKNGIQ